MWYAQDCRQENRNIHAHFRYISLALKQKEGHWNEHEGARDGLKSLGTKSAAPDTLPASKLPLQKMTVFFPHVPPQRLDGKQHHRMKDMVGWGMLSGGVEIPQTPCCDSDHLPQGLHRVPISLRDEPGDMSICCRGLDQGSSPCSRWPSAGLHPFPSSWPHAVSASGRVPSARRAWHQVSARPTVSVWGTDAYVCCVPV